MKIVALLKNLGLISLLLFVTGCLDSRSVVPVDVVEFVGKPTAGIDVKIVSVEDIREFQVRPRIPEIPSLPEDEVNNESIKARAIGRKRNGYGRAMGDVLLPEGQTVASVVKSSISNSFRQAGYRVLKKGDAQYNDAFPISVRVTKFWSWMEIKVWMQKLRNQSEVTIQGPLEKLKKGMTVSSGHEIPMAAVAMFDSEWQISVAQGAAALADRVAEELKK